MAMQIIIEAVAGPVAGRRIVVAQGTTTRLGRTAKSDYAIPEDGYLSGQHFSVECDGTECRVRDLGSSNGTFINGARVSEAVITASDLIVAGGSTFAIRLEDAPAGGFGRTLMGVTQLASGPFGLGATVAAAPVDLALDAAAPPPIIATSPESTSPELDPNGSPRAAAPPPLDAANGAPRWPGYGDAHVKLLSAIYRDSAHVYAVLDASRESRVPAFLDASREQYASLYDGVQAQELGRFATYLVLLPPTARLLDVLIKDGWGKGWGFYLATNASIDEVRRHLQSFFLMRTGSGRPFSFRFADPRILRAFLPLAAPQEATDFFGPMSRLVVEGDTSEVAVEFRNSARGVEQDAIRLRAEELPG